MARKSKVVTIDTEGRDKNKHYVLTEVSAVRAEKWAARAFLALARSGIEIPPDIAKAGMAGIAVLSLRALGGVYFQEIEPLLEEMLTCVQIIPDIRHPEVMRPLVEGQDDIEELSTLLTLRKEIAELHLGFSLLDIGQRETIPPSTLDQTSQASKNIASP